MAPTKIAEPKITHADGVTKVEQVPFTVPELTIKQLLDAIPAHCFKRNAFRSSLYVIYDLAVIAAIYKATIFVESSVFSADIPSLSVYPSLALVTRISIWAIYGFFAGLFSTGLWVIGHECGHTAFAESKFVNHSVGWVIHSALGVPYHSWRITHAKHHASCGHMLQDQVFVPKTRSQLALPPLDLKREDAIGSTVADSVSHELWEALGDSPIGAIAGAASYLFVGWPAYIITNASGQAKYPAGSNHFNPNAVMFTRRHYVDILLSNFGILLWLFAIGLSINHFGFLTVFKTYLVPYLWTNHWLVLIVFLQHTDPLLPHFRDGKDGFTFARGALATYDRNLLGDCGSFMGWLGAHATHGISETHVLHHVSSKIPHYNSWEAADALKKLIGDTGLKLDGRPGGWREMYRVIRACRFVEDEGNVVFYKDARGIAASSVKPTGDLSSDSGVEL